MPPKPGSLPSRPDPHAHRAAAQACLRAIGAACRVACPGTPTITLDDAARASLKSDGAQPLMQLACPPRHMPPVCSVSINDVAIDGRPGARVLYAGDLVTVDLPARVGSAAADLARTWVIEPDESAHDACDPDVARARRALIEATEAIIASAMDAIRPGVAWAEVAVAAERTAEQRGVVLVRGYAGHALGRSVHELPAAPIPRPRSWLGAKGPGVGPGAFSPLPGLILTIEPVVTTGDSEVHDPGPGHPVRTRSGADACTIERMVLVTDRGAVALDEPE